MGGSQWLWEVFSSTGRINAYLLYKRYVQVREAQNSSPKASVGNSSTGTAALDVVGGGAPPV